MLIDRYLGRKRFMMAPAFRNEQERERAHIEHEKQEEGRRTLEEFFGKEFLEAVPSRRQGDVK